MIIGIDFGTSFSSIAVMQGRMPIDNLTDKIEEHLGSAALGIPSLFMYSADQKKELFGIGCLDANPHENPEVIKYMKRKVREDPANIDNPCPSGGNEYLLRDVIEKFVAYLIKSAKEVAADSDNFTNTDIEAMTITTPIGIADGQMMSADYNRLIKETMQNISGLPDNKIHIIAEPVGAAISYLYEENLKKKFDGIQTILVFDLGGGTLDTTVVRHNPFDMTYEIINKEGDLQLGGKDWDDALGQMILKKMGITSIESAEERGEFWDLVTELKINLSNKDEDAKLVNINGKREVVECTRQEFEDATKPLIQRAAEVLKRSVSAIDGGIDTIDGIILVGGSSNMPQVQNMIVSEFPTFDASKIRLYKPSKAIARGAALYAMLNDGNSNGPSSIRIIDSAPCSYGFKFSKAGTDEDMIYNGILKGTKFDENHLIHFKSSSFVAKHDDQKNIVFDFYESQWSGVNAVGGALDHDSIDDEFRHMPLDSGETKNGMSITVQIPPEHLGRARNFSVYVIFDLNQDGLLDITVVDKDNHKLGFVTNRNQ